jgi:uncharacterized metal-binding protein
VPNTETHDRITVITGLAAVPIAWALLPSHDLGEALVVGGAHIISGLIFSPDLDVNSQEYQRWGLLRALWWPYKEFVPHRNWLSHGLVIGPLLRLAYFGCVLYLLLWVALLLLAPFLHFDAQEVLARVRAAFRLLVDEQRALVLSFLIGFITGSAAHSIPDWLQTHTKITLREWGLRRAPRRRSRWED